MSSVNKVILVGRLGKDPEVRVFPNGGQIASASIATTEKWRDKNTGENREVTEWHNLVFQDRLAEIAGQYLKKGSLVYVEGSLRTRKWQDQSGVDRYTTEVRVASMQMLGGGREDGQPSQQQPRPTQQQRPTQPRPAAAKAGQTNSYEATRNGQMPANPADDDIPF